MKNKLTSRVLAILLAVVMVVGMLPISALAARVDRDAPMAEVAMGEEAVAAPARKPSVQQVEAALSEGEETSSPTYEYVLDTDGLDIGGVYVIYTNYDTADDRVLYCSATGTRTDMLRATCSGNTLELTSTGFETNTQLWEVVEVEIEGTKGIGLKSLASGKYLKVKSDAVHADIDVDATQQALTITANSGSAGRYKVVQDGWSLNWSSKRFQAYNADNNYYVRFFKQTAVVTETPEAPEVPEGPRYYFAKAAAGSGPWTLVSEGKGVANLLSYQTSGGFSGDLTALGDTEGKLYRIFADANNTGIGFLNTTAVDNVRVATAGTGYNASDPNTGAILVTFEAQSGGGYFLSVTRDSVKYYLTAKLKTHDDKECAVFSRNVDDAVTYYVEYDGGFRIFCTVEPEREEPEVDVIAPPAELETVLEYRRASGEFTEGTYAIVGTTREAVAGSQVRVMHPWYNSSGVLTVDQCRVGDPDAETLSINDNKLCGTGTHLFTVTKSGEGYTFKVELGNAAGKYLAVSGSGVSLSDTATVFTVTAVDGGYNLSAGGNYISWENGWKASTTAYRLNLYKEGNAPFAMAQTVFKGTGDRPMDPENPGSYFRIPSLVTLDNGWIMATSDIRWYSTNDSPNNLDTIVSISKDGGVNWEYEVVNYFSDYAPTKQFNQPYGPAKGGSASFIDPAVVQSEVDGSIYLLVDAQPPYVNGGKIGNGFDSQGRLKISKSPANSGYTMENAHDNNLHGYTFDYYVDINNAAAGADHTVDGETVKLWPICANEDDSETGYYADAFFNTYYDYGEEGIKAVLAVQHDSTEVIHNNLFYTQSEWKVFPTAFIMLRKATINQETGKLDWGDPKLLNGQIKHENEHFIGVCPGRGVVTTVNGKERIIFALYDNQTGTELASTIYSDDGGETWTRGAHTPDVTTNNTGKSSESQIVVLPDGNGGTFLRMYSRNGIAKLSYADSTDGGATWGTSMVDPALNAGNQSNNAQGCMVSFINLKGYLVDGDGNVYENLVLASYPQGTANGGSAKRTNGAIRIGYYDPAVGNGPVTWLNEEKTWYAGSYIYSCLTQRLEGDAEGGAPSGNFALLYETDDSPTVNAANKHFTDILFTTFTVTDILGEGWTLAQTKPEPPEPPEPPVADVYTVGTIEDCVYTGEAIEPTVTVRKNGEILTEGYTLAYSNNVNVGTARVDVVVDGEVVATGTFRIVEDTAGGDTGNTGSNTGSGSGGSSYSPAPAEEDLEDLDVPLAQLPTIFEDVKVSDWFCAAAEFVLAKNLMLGVSATEFRPTMNTTRGMVVTILYRMEEEPEADPAAFMDVASTAWYGPAVAWGAQSDVVKGANDGGFHPMDDVTREQLAVFLYRFAEHRGYDVTVHGELSGYVDSETVSDWAADAMSWAVGTGLITGKGGNVLDPLSTATRAELATILTRFCKQFIEEK